MSERQIRVFAKLAVDSYPVSELIEAYFAAMHEEPDLVVLLRTMYDRYEEASGMSGEEAAYEQVIDEIEKTVRLTDEPPGWKWIERE